MQNAIQESGEMYLETILVLGRKGDAVRSVDVSSHMGYSKPSVSRAIGILRRNGYLNMDAAGHLTLTESGREIAEKIYERHNILTSLLVSLGVDEEVASKDACRMEHAISDETLDAMKRYVEKTKPTEEFPGK